MQGVAPLIRAHHERWDGQGFPDGLRGTAIPLGARILAVADAYEDLRGGRIDGEALSPSEARRAVLAGRGSQFDPSVVDAFASLFSIASPETAVPLQHLRTADLRAGQVLLRDFVSPEGVLLLSSGQRLNEDLITRIVAFEKKHGRALTLAVQVPAEAGR